MLYRVEPAATPADLAAAAHAIGAALPDRAVTSTGTWLANLTNVNSTADLMVPILLAFGAFAFLAAAFIIVNVISGIVIGSTRQIGLLKAMGTTPGQVSLVLFGQILVPSVVGAAFGTLAGLVAAQPILAQTAGALGVPTLVGPSPAVLLGVPAAALVVTTVSALVPALRAGRMAATQAITSGATPSTGRAAGLTRALLERTALPDSIALGVGRLAARPLRTLMTFGALAVGVAAITFTFGMEGSLRAAGAAFYRDAASAVRADYRQGPGVVPGGTGPALTADQVTAAIAAQPGVARSVAIAHVDVTVAGLATPVPYFAYQSDASWLGYALIDGRWFSAPGEVVVPTNFLAQTGLRVGDSPTVTLNGRAIPLTIVGSIFDNARTARDSPRNVVIRGGWDPVAGADPKLAPTEWEIANDPNLIRPDALAQALRQATNNAVGVFPANSAAASVAFLLFEGVVAILGVLLIVVSLGGVINTVLLEARERARQTAILRAVGMTPRQVIAMVIASVAPLGVLAGIAGLPLGVALQQLVVADMARLSVESDVPPSIGNILAPADLALIVASGLALALVGAWLPARRTSRSPIAPVLQAE
jgi:putative ABC transport system permease protein